MRFLTKKKIPYQIVGNGSNIIGTDKGFNGVIIRLSGKFKKYKLRGKKAVFGAGLNLFRMNKILADRGLSGMEFSFGIPASVGGAVAMNAGAFGDDFSNHVLWVFAIKNNKIVKFSNKKCQFSYRNSVFLKNKLIIISVCFKLNFDQTSKILERQNFNLDWRKRHQPYKERSAGSVFLRQGDFLPAKAIDQLNLKGLTMGGVQVSKIHAGFIINLGEATCQDFLNLLSYIKKEVYKRMGRQLSVEVKIMGD